MTKPVTILLTEAQEAHFSKQASQQAVTLETLLADAVQRQLDYDAWFHSEIQAGIDAADRGELLSQEEFLAEGQRVQGELATRPMRT